MIIQRLASLFKVRPEETRLVILVGALFMCIQAGGGMGDNAASALFLLRFGAEFLPYMYLVLGGFNFICTLAYTAALGRFKKGQFFLWMLAGFAGVLVLERAAILRPAPFLYPALWLTINGLSLILGTFVWNLAGEVCDARQAKRLFPLFTSAGILGSVLGNSITGIVAKILGTDNLILLYAALLGLAFFLTFQISRSNLKPATRSAKSQNLLKDLRVGFDFVRGSSLMRLIAYTSILFSILFFAIAFPFNKVVSTSYPDEAQVAGFLGLFSSLTTAATLIVSLFIANRLYARLGIVNSVLLMPIAYIFGFVAFAFNYNLFGAATARFAQLVILSGVAGTAWSALFNVVPSQKRAQVLAFQNGVPSQIGVMLSGMLLIVGELALNPQQVLLMGIALALVCAVMIWRMRSAYGEALIAALRAGRVEVFNAQDMAFSGLQHDAFAVNVALQSLHDHKPTTRRLAAEIIGKMGATSVIPALTGSLTDPDSNVRSTVLRTLGELKAVDAFPAILTALEDRERDVRVSALAALSTLDLESNPTLQAKMENLSNDPDLKVQMQAAVVLAKFDSGRRASIILNELFKTSGLDHRILALEMLTQVSVVLNKEAKGSFDIQPVLSALDDAAPLIRKTACQVLGNFGIESLIQNIIERLYDSDASVRRAAAESLRGFGATAQAGIIQVLGSKNGYAQEAALEALSADDPAIHAALMEYVSQEILDVRELRLGLQSLAGDGRALMFLRDRLEIRMTSSEERLIKTVGLFGNPQAMDLVRKSLHAPDNESRAASLETLETLGDKRLTQEIIPLLEENLNQDHRVGGSADGPADVLAILLTDYDDWVRVLSIRAIYELDLRTFIPKLGEMRSDPHPFVGQSARETLIQFDKEKSMNTLQTVSTLERILLLREVPIFADLSPEDLKQVAEIAQEQWIPDGTIICRDGEDGDSMYIIVAGQVQILKGVEGSEKILAVRGVGDFVGEMAIIESGPRVATVRAHGDVRVLVIDGDAFNAILRDRQNVAISVMRTLSRRLREMMN
jgi:HEAT repeat protein